jgi:hypothetical protein
MKAYEKMRTRDLLNLIDACICIAAWGRRKPFVEEKRISSLAKILEKVKI